MLSRPSRPVERERETCNRSFVFQNLGHYPSNTGCVQGGREPSPSRPSDRKKAKSELCVGVSLSLSVSVCVCVHVCLCVCVWSCMFLVCIYIYGTPPHVPTPVFSISALGRDGFLSCRTAWVNGRKSACKSYVSSLSSSAKLSPRTQMGRTQRYSKRILLNTPRIQDSRFKVPGRTLPCTLNLESWIRGVFNRIRFEYV